MSRRRVARLALTFTVLAGCRSSGDEERIAVARLPSGTVAAVGDEVIGPSLVESIARAQHLSPQTARDAAISDALFAVELRHRRPATSLHLRRIAHARALLERLREDAERKGAPTDEEIASITASRWWEFDRPPMRRTTHVVVRVADPSQDSSARSAIERIASAVAGVRDRTTFNDRASKVHVEGLEVRVEHLDPVAADGRAVDPDNPPAPAEPEQHFDRDFVDAVFAIPSVGEQSPIVRTKFGYHVILYSAEVPERRVPLAEKKRLLQAEVFTRRADAARRSLTERLRRETPVSVERSAMELTEGVQGGS